ncbi:hypothetical protein UlMin_019381, partial [Ulmus minor]
PVKDNDLHLDWPTRFKICLGTARGLAYLHDEPVARIVHRDVKASNILLDATLCPKISDWRSSMMTIKPISAHIILQRQ